MWPNSFNDWTSVITSMDNINCSTDELVNSLAKLNNAFTTYNTRPKLYKLNDGDVFTIIIDTFMRDSKFWRDPYKIVGFDRIKRQWWKLWAPKYTYYVKLEYVEK